MPKKRKYKYPWNEESDKILRESKDYKERQARLRQLFEKWQKEYPHLQGITFSRFYNAAVHYARDKGMVSDLKRPNFTYSWNEQELEEIYNNSRNYAELEEKLRILYEKMNPGKSFFQFRSAANKKAQSLGCYHERHKGKSKRNSSRMEDFIKNLPQFATETISFLQKEPKTTIDALGDYFNLDPQSIVRILDYIAKETPYSIFFDEAEEKVELIVSDVSEQRDPERITVSQIKEKGKRIFRDTITVCFMQGLKLGSRFQQMPVLYYLFQDIFPKWYVESVIVCGGLVAGVVKDQDTFLYEMAETLGVERPKKRKKIDIVSFQYNLQAEYVARFFPMLPKNIPADKVHIIGGLEEISFQKFGLQPIVPYIIEKRKKLHPNNIPQDMYFKGNHYHEFLFSVGGEELPLVVVTPKKKPWRGVYTRSYRPQKAAITFADKYRKELRSGQRTPEMIPRVIQWTDGSGYDIELATGGGFIFVSPPQLSVDDSVSQDIDSPSNFGVSMLQIFFDERGNVKPYGVKTFSLDLTRFQEKRGW